MSQSLSVGIGFSVRWSRASLHACISSLCGMLVYRDATSRVTRIAPGEISLSELSLVKKWVVSLIYDGSLGASGFRWWSTDIFRYSLSRVIGRPGFPCLWIFGLI